MLLIVLSFFLSLTPVYAQTDEPTSVTSDPELDARMCNIVVGLVNNDTVPAAQFGLDFVEEYRPDYPTVFISYRNDPFESPKQELYYEWNNGVLDAELSDAGSAPTDLPGWGYSIYAFASGIGPDWKNYYVARDYLFYTQSEQLFREYKWATGEYLYVHGTDGFDKVECPDLEPTVTPREAQ